MGNSNSKKAKIYEAKEETLGLIGDANVEIWIEHRRKLFLMTVTSTVTKRKPSVKRIYDWAVEQHFDDGKQDPILIAYASDKEFQRAFLNARKVIAKKLGFR